MTENITEPVVETTPPENDGPKQLREALKRSQAENATLSGQLMERAYTDAGLDTSTGLGKAISQVYDGDPETASILTFAKEEYGYEPVKAPENPKQPAIVQGQAQLDALNDSTTPIDPPSESDALAEAEQKGDFATAGAIKAAQLGRMYQPR